MFPSGYSGIMLCYIQADFIKRREATLSQSYVTAESLPPHRSVCRGHDGSKAGWGRGRSACERFVGRSSGLLHPVGLRWSPPVLQKHSPALFFPSCLGGFGSDWMWLLYLCDRPSAYDFAHTANPAKPFQPVRLDYRGVAVQVVAHCVVAA